MTIISRGTRSDSMPNRREARHLSPNLKKATDEVTPWISAEDPGIALDSYVRNLVASSSGRLSDNIRYLSIYANEDFFRSAEGADTQVEEDFTPVTDNQIRIQVDTTAGKLIQANSRISMLTNQGDFALWRKAQKCEAAIQAEWSRMRLYRELQQVAKDGLITGNGFVKLNIVPHKNVINCKRVFPNEVFVNSYECHSSKPTKMYQATYQARDELVAIYPDAGDTIMKAASAAPPTFPWTLYSAGQIAISEAWVLPIGTRAGRHIIACSAGTILDEEWKHDCFPIVKFSPADFPIGWYGQGVVSQVEAAQVTLNQMLAIMQEGAALAIAPFWVVAQGANISLKHLDNIPGHIVEVAGSVDPKWITNAPFHQAAPVYCDLLKTIIGDQFGNNAMDTGGDPPINRIDSKKALREYQDMTSAHITLMIERWSKELFLDLAHVTLMLASDIARKVGKYPVLVQKNYKRVVQGDWKDYDLPRDAYMLTPAPSNLLPQTPSGKTQDLMEMMQAGLINQKQAQRMIMGPQDANAMLAESCAEEDDIDDLIEGFIDRDEYRSPNSYQDLNHGLARVARARLQYAINGCPAETLHLFDRWLADAEDTLQRQMQQPAPTPPQGAMPNGPEQTQPTVSIGGPSPDGGAAGQTLALPAGQPAVVPSAPPGGPPVG